MKLIDLLKIELPKRGGWPEGADYVVQDCDGSCDIKFGSGYSYPCLDDRGVWVSVLSRDWSIDTDESYIRDFKILASDASTIVVTQEQYEAAVASESNPASSRKHTAHSFLEKGVQHMKDRAVQRDSEDGERSMKACVDAFNVMFAHNLTETQGWQFMVLLKMSRSRNKFNPDDYEDAAAYSGLAGEARSNEQK